jgi:hypothetical protein
MVSIIFLLLIIEGILLLFSVNKRESDLNLENKRVTQKLLEKGIDLPVSRGETGNGIEGIGQLREVGFIPYRVPILKQTCRPLVACTMRQVRSPKLRRIRKCQLNL